MTAEGLIGLIDTTYEYFGALGNWHQDPAGIDAVREIRDRMVRDLEVFDSKPTKSEVAELIREWRALRIEITGEATYPPDMFIESVCQAIEIS